MSDETGPTPGGTPEHSSGHSFGDDARIRALLAELGSGPDGESMPPPVAARLDDTLARLVAERAAASEERPGDAQEETTATVTPLRTPLRRRRTAWLTAAAAAVIVLGGGGVAVTRLGVFDGTGATSKSNADAGGSTAGDPETLLPSPSALGKAPDGSALRPQALPRVRSASYAADVTALVRREAVIAPAPLPGSKQPGKAGDHTPRDLAGQTARRRTPAAELDALGCAGPKIVDGAVRSPIRYDGQVAVLVVHPAKNGEQLVETWSCRGNRRLDSATITP